MPRRHESNLEMILRDLSRMPWWASVMAAVFVFVVARVVVGTLKGPMLAPLGNLVSVAGTLLAILFLIPGVISFVRSHTTPKQPDIEQRNAAMPIARSRATDALQRPDTDSRQTVFLSQFEKVVYEVARELWPSSLVLPNAALQTVFKFDKMKGLIEPELFGYYLKSMVDVCVYDSSTYAPLFAIEVDGDRYHGSDGSRLRDKKKDDIFRVGGVPLIRLRMDRMVEKSMLKEKLLSARASLNQTIRQVSVAV
jgi:hypothetical protein